MKEYRIQIRFENRFASEWVSARTVFGGVWNSHPYTDERSTKDSLESLVAHWETEADRYHKEKPIEYRIIFREVTEWRPV